MQDTADSFGERQFSGEGTRAQLWFDVSFGLALPVLCIGFDPIVFRAPAGMASLIFRDNAVLGYMCFASGWISLLVWLVWGRASAVLCGLLAGGGLFASYIGLMLLPLSVGLLVGAIGAIVHPLASSLAGLAMVAVAFLGLIPCLTGFAFFRNCGRMYAQLGRNWLKSIAGAVCGLALFIAPGLAVQAYIDRSIESAIEGVVSDDPVKRASGLETIRLYKPISSPERLVWRYGAEENPTARERLQTAYRDLTGGDIQRQLEKRID